MKTAKKQIAKKTDATQKTSAKKTSTKRKEEINEKNKANIEKSITKEKDLLYKYPSECDTLPLRKKFRTATRRKLNNFQKNIAKASGNDKKLLQKKARIWWSKTFAKGLNPFK